jgi:hypothetical protein
MQPFIPIPVQCYGVAELRPIQGLPRVRPPPEIKMNPAITNIDQLPRRREFFGDAISSHKLVDRPEEDH